jgi:WD40 repeat protein
MSSGEEDEFAPGNKKDAAKAMKGAGKYGDEQNQVYDEVLSALFEKVPPGEGDEFGAVKPWLGAIKEPKPKPKINKKAPKENYEIDWVYGYRSEEACMNAAFNSAGHLVYPTAALGVVFNYKDMTQLYFGGGKTDFSGRKQDDESKDGHSDDVTALCVSFSRKMVASGQNGQKPLIMMWNAETAEVMGKKRLPKGCRLVTAIGISATDKYICATDAAEKISAHIFKVDGGVSAIATAGINMKVMHLAWSPMTEEKFATAGAKHVMICTLNKDKVDAKKGKGSKGKDVTNQCSIAFVPDEKYKDHYITGDATGEVLHWTGDSITKAYPLCKGSVMSVAARKQGDDVLVFAGGKDKKLTVFKFDGKLNKLWEVEVDAAPRSLDLFNDQILMGLKNGSLVVMPYTADGKGKPDVVMTSHCDGEVWGLEVIEIAEGDYRILTSADDNRILAYNVGSRQALAEGKVGEPPKKKAKGGYRGGASSMSSEPAECQSRCVAWSSKLKHLACSNNKGRVSIREVDWAKVDAREAGSLDVEKKSLWKELNKDPKKNEWIEAMAYSPDHTALAIGSHDNTIYLLDTKSYKKCTKLTGHSSFITALDFSIDGAYLRSVCGAYELLFFNVKSKKRDPSGASNTVETVWADHTCKLGWCVQGIFPSGCDGSHINSCAMSKNGKLLASGDDYGLVCVYNNPLLEGHASKKYRGHSEHVTSVKFSPDQKSTYLFSTGGQDQTTIQWKMGK